LQLDDRARIVPFGEAALLVTLGERIDSELNRRVHRLAELVTAEAERSDRAGRRTLGIPVPAHASLLVPFDPEAIDAEQAEREVAAIVAELENASTAAGEADAESRSAPPLDIAVRYGGEDGPDLDWVAEARGLSSAEVVRLHGGTIYTVFMLGFVPGFAYLGSLPPALVTPRRPTPRPRVPAGSVGIAGEQTAIYPTDTPGGWQLIGRTDLRVWDSGRDPPALLVPGTRVRFVALDG
jgi:KipI family sensor histidine kinase inhibitor